jgi:3-phenylpropionate/cinnamic acid dioxygenase small subunit
LSLALKEEHGLGISENRRIRIIFGSKREEVRDRRKSLNGEQIISTSRPSTRTKIFERKRVRGVGHRGLMEIRENYRSRGIL